MLIGQGRDGVSDRAEVVDDHEAVDPQSLLHQRRADHPRVVGELEDVAADGTGEGQGKLVWKVRPCAPAEFLPCELEAAMLGCLERDGFAERGDAIAVKLREREAGVGPADVGDGDLPHAFSASIAASIAEAPASASFT